LFKSLIDPEPRRQVISRIRAPINLWRSGLIWSDRGVPSVQKALTS